MGGAVGECLARSIDFAYDVSSATVARYFVSGFIIDDGKQCSNHVKGYECMNAGCRGHRHIIFEPIVDAPCTRCPFGRALPPNPDWKTVPRVMVIFHMKRVKMANPDFSREEVRD